VRRALPHRRMGHAEGPVQERDGGCGLPGQGAAPTQEALA
jgi:hypothetical protein